MSCHLVYLIPQAGASYPMVIPSNASKSAAFCMFPMIVASSVSRSDRGSGHVHEAKILQEGRLRTLSIFNVGIGDSLK